jgi:hypothetical protein
VLAQSAQWWRGGVGRGDSQAPQRGEAVDLGDILAEDPLVDDVLVEDRGDGGSA